MLRCQEGRVVRGLRRRRAGPLAGARLLPDSAPELAVEIKSVLAVHVCNKRDAQRPGSIRFLFAVVAQPRSERLPGIGQPGGHRALRNAQDGRYIAVAVAVEMAQDDRGRLLGWKTMDFPQKVGADVRFGGIRLVGPAQPPD